MNRRTVIAVAAIAVVIALLIVLTEDPPPGAGDLVPDDRSSETGNPLLESRGAAPPPQGSEPPKEEPVPPSALPERPVEIDGLRVRLGGRVLDPQGKPLPDVPVRVYAYFDSTMKNVPLHAETLADGEGRFALDFHPQTTVTNRDPYIRLRVAAFHPTWVMAIANAYVDSLEVDEAGYVREDIELLMRQPFQLLCRVRDVDGRLIEGAICAFEQFYGRKRWIDGRPVVAETNEAGEARLKLPRIADDVILLRLHGHHAFRVSAPGYATVYARVNVPEVGTPGNVYVTEVVLTAPHEIRGVLRDDTGAPIPNEEVSVTGRRVGTWGAYVASRWSDHALRTDDSGGFVLSSVQAGTWKLEFYVEGHRTGRVQVDAGTADLEVTLRRVAPTVLLFRDAKSGVYLGVQEYTITYGGGGGSRTTGGDAELRVELDDLPPGTHAFEVQLAGRAQPFGGSFKAVPGRKEPIVFDVPPSVGGSTVTGIVVDPAGDTLAGVWMKLSPVGRAEDEEEGDVHWRTREGGAFRFEGIPPGRYALEIDAEGFATRYVHLDLPRASPTELRIVMSHGATLRVVFPSVPEGATWKYDVRIERSGGDGIDGRFMGRGDKDSVVFAHEAPGEAWAILESSQFRSRRFAGDPYTRRIVLEEGREAVVSFAHVRPVRVQGRVIDAEGKPVADTRLQLRRIGPAYPLEHVLTHTFYGSKRAPTDDNGAFDLGGLVPGRYAVANLTKGSTPLTFVVPDAHVEDLVLTLE